MRRKVSVALVVGLLMATGVPCRPAAGAPAAIVPHTPPVPREIREVCIEGHCYIEQDFARLTDQVATGSDGGLWFPMLSSSSLSSAGGLAVQQIVRLDPRTGRFTALPGLPGSIWVSTIVPGPDGNLWLADNYSEGGIDLSRLVRLEPALGRLTIFPIPPPAHPSSSYWSYVSALAAGRDGRLWFVNVGTREIGGFDPSTGDVVAHFPLPSYVSGRRLAVAPDGTLWVPGGYPLDLDSGGTLYRITVTEEVLCSGPARGWPG